MDFTCGPTRLHAEKSPADHASLSTGVHSAYSLSKQVHVQNVSKSRHSKTLTVFLMRPPPQLLGPSSTVPPPHPHLFLLWFSSTMTLAISTPVRICFELHQHIPTHSATMQFHFSTEGSNIPLPVKIFKDMVHSCTVSSLLKSFHKILCLINTVSF